MIDVQPTLLVPYIAGAAAYAALAALILAQARRSPTGLLLAAAAALTALWAATTAVVGASTADRATGVAAALDLARLLAWYGFCLHLYRRSRSDGGDGLFTAIGLAASVCAVATLLFGQPGLPPGRYASADAAAALSLFSPAILLRLTLAIGQLLLLENLYRGSAPERRWHVGLACIALGGVAAYDMVVCADAVLLHAASPTLVAGRPLVAALVAPLLAMAAARNRQWRIDIHVSRAAAFHSATLVVSGVFLLALAAAGELARQLGASFAAGWGSLAEICVVFAGIITVALLLTSGAARGALRRVVVDHFFTHRYDYRREWQRCIDTLAATGSGKLPERVIRALGDVVDSPAGLLFTHEAGQAGLSWSAAWNTPPTGALTAPEWHALLANDGPTVLQRSMLPSLAGGNFEAWLAVPLGLPGPQTAGAAEPQDCGPLGLVLLTRPRAPFRLDAEVFELLRVLAHEVSVHLVQERATATLLQTRELRAYGERFAFVAHDIKNVSSQLSLLLSNAETHLADPEFQKDMLATVRASVARIGGLIRRLEPGAPLPKPIAEAVADMEFDPPAGVDPATLLAAAARRAIGAAIRLGPMPALPVAMPKAALEAAITHLLDNAVAAAGPTGEVRLGLALAEGRAVIDIEDNGRGMTPEFIRDELFRPFATSKPDGSGIGAFQARELVRAAGGDISVVSRTASVPGVAPGARSGTLMRLSLPLAASVPASRPASRPALAA